MSYSCYLCVKTTSFHSLLASFISLRRFAPMIVSNPDLSGLDSSIYSSDIAELILRESHYALRFELRKLVLSESH